MNKRQKRGIILVALGFLLVFGAVGLHAAQDQEDALAGENAKVLLRHLQLSSVTVTPPAASDRAEDAPSGQIPEETVPLPTTMAEKEYMGYSMIGTIRIPSVNIELPVMSSWSYDLLKVAPCRYSGSIGGGDLIIMGHNYKSHFTPMKKVKAGAEVEFEDVNGMVYRYVVEKVEQLHKSEVDRLASEYDLTLFTCTASGQNRFVLRCNLVSE